MLYLPALKCGIGVFEYWEMTYGEITDLIQIHREKEEEKTKTEIANNYQIATLTAIFINRANHGEAPPTLHEIYPSIFGEPEKEVEDNSWMLLKEQMIDFAEERNKQRGDKNK